MKKRLKIVLVFIIINIMLISCMKEGSDNNQSSQVTSDGNSSSKDVLQSSSDGSQPSSEESSQPSSQSGAVSSNNSSSNRSDSTITSKPNSKPQSDGNTASSKPSDSFTWDRGGNYTGPIVIKEATSPKENVLSDGNAMIDVSNASEGYITVSYTGSKKRLKFQVKKDNVTYNYDLNNQGHEEVFPLQLGSGSYQFRVMENVTGSQYIQLFSETVEIHISNSFGPFLYPNQYANYNAQSHAVKKSFDLTMNANSDLDKVRSIYNYIITTIKYDNAKAATVQSGYLPNVDNTLATKKGICFDYAALMAAMLRAQNIPTKLVVGDVAPNGIRHAWNDVYIKGKGWITIGIQSDGSQWKRLDATFSASEQAKISEFINNSANYTTLRIY